MMRIQAKGSVKGRVQISKTVGNIEDDQIATDDDIHDLLDEIFGGIDDGNDVIINEEDVATDEEINQLLDEVFGS